MRQQNELDQNVRERVMKVAGKLFSEKGFAGVTVREICQTAEANIAAINYYFRNKENLYVEVVKHWQRVAFEKFPLAFAQDETNPPEDRLRSFIQCQLMQTLYRIESPWFSAFISRESIESSRAIEELVTESLGPSINLLFDIIRHMMGQDTPDNEVRYYCASILGQCSFYLYIPNAIKKYFIAGNYTLNDITVITEHVYNFTMAAITIKNQSITEK